MSGDRPNFAAIEEKLREEENNHNGRELVRSRLANLIANYGEQPPLCPHVRITTRIHVDDKGTVIYASEKTLTSGKKEYCIDMQLVNADSTRGTRWPIVEICESENNDWDVLNHKRDKLSGNEIQQAFSILEFMREYYVSRSTPVIQA